MKAVMISTFFTSVVFPALSTLFFASFVDAHGYISFFSVDGSSYAGNSPGANPKPSVIRQISTIDPVKGASNTNLMCGQNAQNAALIANVMPGSTVTFQWTDGPGNWPHNTGPLMTYMASCGSTTCDQFDPTNARWFKIDQIGRKPGSADWYQLDIMNGGSYSTKIPATLANGQYLIRHEIIALHLAVTIGGAEFYPACLQVNVGGNQVGVASSNELVSFPGAYSDNDPGIYDPSVYDSTVNYTFPGPPVAQMAISDLSSDSTGPPITSGSFGSAGISGASSTSVSGSRSTLMPSNSLSFILPSSTSVNGPTTVPSGSNTCTLSRRTLLKRNSAIENSPPRPKHFSRVMGRILHGNTW